MTSHRTPDERLVVVIPARFASVRLPGKPLLDLCGKPLIQHVYERAALAGGVDDVLVATDDARIAQACRAFGARVAMTSPDCASGTDRVAQALQDDPCDIAINVQGDEPLLDPLDVERLARHMREHPDEGMATLATPLREAEAFNEASVVKVVCDAQGHALYFSRAPIPHRREPGGAAVAPLKHLGVYAFRREALQRFIAWPPSPLEQTEKLEQLRALENGLRIRVLVTDNDSVGVDTPEDAERVRALLRQTSTNLDPG